MHSWSWVRKNDVISQFNKLWRHPDLWPGKVTEAGKGGDTLLHARITWVKRNMKMKKVINVHVLPMYSALRDRGVITLGRRPGRPYGVESAFQQPLGNLAWSLERSVRWKHYGFWQKSNRSYSRLALVAEEEVEAVALVERGFGRVTGLTPHKVLDVRS